MAPHNVKVVTRLCAGESKPYPDIYISDNSLPWDGARMGTTTDPTSPIPGIRIKISSAVAAHLPIINIEDHLTVTVISGAIGGSDATALYTGSGIRNIRVVRVRKPDDIVKVSP